MIDRKRVIDLHRQGLSQDAIAAEMGCSQATISYHLRRAGLTEDGRYLSSFWMDIRDGLPGHRHEVLVTVKDARRTGQAYIDIARHDGHWIFRNGRHGRVTAWMELPEEYQG